MDQTAQKNARLCQLLSLSEPYGVSRTCANCLIVRLFCQIPGADQNLIDHFTQVIATLMLERDYETICGLLIAILLKLEENHD